MPSLAPKGKLPTPNRGRSGGSGGGFRFVRQFDEARLAGFADEPGDGRAIFRRNGEAFPQRGVGHAYFRFDAPQGGMKVTGSQTIRFAHLGKVPMREGQSRRIGIHFDFR